MKQNNYFMGVDIGGTKTYILIEDEQKNQILMKYLITDPDITYLIDSIFACMREVGLTQEDIGAMGVGIPGRVDANNGIVIDAPGLGWQEYDILSVLKEAFSFPIFINNDVRMALIGERSRADHGNVKDMVFISIGTGLGSAILLNDIIISGKDNCAGEIGYFICQKDIEQGFQNTDGAFGTMETYVSGSALFKEAQKLQMTPEEMFLCYHENHPLVKKVIDTFILDLSYLISNIVSLLDPELVVVGGGVSDSLVDFTDAINDTVSRFTPLRAKVIISLLGSKTGVLGASEYGRISKSNIKSQMSLSK